MGVQFNDININVKGKIILTRDFDLLHLSVRRDGTDTAKPRVAVTEASGCDGTEQGETSPGPALSRTGPRVCRVKRSAKVCLGKSR